MWFCSSPFGSARHSGKSSRVSMSGCRFYIIRLISTSVRGVSSSRHCFALFALSSRYWNTSCLAFVRKMWTAASWWVDCRDDCLRSLIAVSGSLKLTFKRLPRWQIWSEKWFKRCIFTKLKSDLSTGCCSISDSLCSLSSSTRQCMAAAEGLFQEGSLSRSSCLSKVNSFLKASETCFVDLLVRNCLKTSLWWWNSSRSISMYLIVASVWYRTCAIWWEYTTLLTHNRASVKGILWFARGFKRVSATTGTITCPSAVISSHLHCITWQNGLLNRVKTGYGGIIAQSWLNLSILECCLRKDVTHSIKCLSIPR